jgi:hypothetical protein
MSTVTLYLRALCNSIFATSKSKLNKQNTNNFLKITSVGIPAPFSPALGSL